MSSIDRILQLVEESGLTAKDYAINAGLGAGNITDWKTGRSKPSVESLQKIAEYANVQMEWLTGNSEFRTKEEELDNYLKDQDTLIIVKTIEKYSNDFAELGFNENSIYEVVDLLCFNRQKYSPQEQGNLIVKYLEKYDSPKKEKLLKLFIKILEELTLNEQNMNIFHFLMSSIEKEKKSKSRDSLLSYRYYLCPIYGRISAGQPNWAEECLEGTLPIDPELMGILNPEECFFLRVNGESMNKIVKNGAFALIRKQDVVDDGDIAVVLVDKYDATLKKFKRLKSNGLVMLEPQSSSDEFEPIILDPSKSDIKIIGKYIGKMEME